MQMAFQVSQLLAKLSSSTSAECLLCAQHEPKTTPLFVAMERLAGQLFNSTIVYLPLPI